MDNIKKQNYCINVLVLCVVGVVWNIVPCLENVMHFVTTEC
jgi:hypothetical protein